ncbi:FlgD immunoglobulin-like domain containing protein, partial [Nocardioides sp. GCM10028917]|uniref:FlgD immunoglobulin-like domain containing protein n=1 Tax=Nocardioides sp. GCM10028917 TaxID=3273408 RepID=UPI00360E5D90
MGDRRRTVVARLRKAAEGGSISLAVLVSTLALLSGTLAASTAAEPPVQVTLTDSPRYIYPVLSDAEESVSYSFYLNRPANVTAIVRDADLGVVRTLLTGVSVPSGSRYYAWDFRDGTGQPVEDGAYTIDITATASDGTTSDVTQSTGINRLGKPAISGVGDDAEVSGTLSLAVQPPASLPVTSMRFRAGTSTNSSYCVDGGATAAGADGAFRDDLSVDECGAGTRVVFAQMSWKDPLGASHSGTTRSVPVTVVDAVAPVVTTPEPATTYR